MPEEHKVEFVSKLTDDCGHHCGVTPSGKDGVHIGHCPCIECHGRPEHNGITKLKLAGVSLGGVDG